MVFNITEHVQGVQYLLRFWRSDGVLNLNTHFYSVVFDLFCIFGKIPMNNSSFKLKFLPMPLLKHFRFCLWWESFFNGGHFSTCQTRKKSTSVTFFYTWDTFFYGQGSFLYDEKWPLGRFSTGVVIRRYTCCATPGWKRAQVWWPKESRLTIRGDKDQDPIASVEDWTRLVIKSPPPC